MKKNSTQLSYKTLLFLPLLLLISAVYAGGITLPAVSSSIIFTAPVQNNNMFLGIENNPTQEGYTLPAVRLGSPCQEIPAGKFMYSYSTRTAVPTSATSIIISITYYDSSMNSIWINYTRNGNAGGWGTADFQKSNTQKWITRIITITDAGLDGSMGYGGDIRMGFGGENNYIKDISISVGTLNPSTQPIPAKPNNPSSEFVGKSFAGYQLWHQAGATPQDWLHWSYGMLPAAGRGNHNTETFPHISDFNGNPNVTMYPTNFANLGDGTPTKLYNSTDKGVIDVQMGLLKNAGFDGVAIQRNAPIGRALKASADDYCVSIKNACEANGRLFYMMYCMPDTNNGSAHLEDVVAGIERDWVFQMEQVYALTSSSAYATVNGKPVVELWGLGYSTIEVNNPQALALAAFFKARGCYVIAGTPRDWRLMNEGSRTDFANVYKAYDMISPWTVGAYNDTTSANGYKTNYEVADKAYCDANAMGYYPVVFVGSAWSEPVSGYPNDTKRVGGKFLWQQALNANSIGVKSMYYAMLDEFEESTDIINAATDYFDIPTDQYFGTLAMDGIWCSPDYYLRLGGAAARMLTSGTSPAVIPIPYSLGPIYYRNSFESRVANCIINNVPQNIVSPIDACFYHDAVITNTAVTSPSVAIVNPATTFTKSGVYSTQITGTATGASKYYYQVSETKIAVKANMALSFWKYSVNALGQNTAVDLTFKSGKTLHTLPAYTDNNGNAMTPTIARGTVGTWQKFTCQIGKGVLIGDEIDGISIAYDNAAASGNFNAYFDDIIIQDAVDTTTSPSIFITYSNPLASNNLTQFTVTDPTNEPYTVQTTQGGLDCIQIPGSKYAYYNVNDAAITSTQNDLIFTITYFDQGTDNIAFQYNATGGSNYTGMNIQKTGTNTWITATIALTDASFRNAENNGSDFRIGTTTGFNNYIRAITITTGTLNPATEPVPVTTGSAYSEFKGKSVAGYQAWFTTGNTSSGWIHWAGGAPPAVNNLSFEVYPDTREYAAADLTNTNFANLGNGQAASLFNSSNDSVISKHFSWMQTAGIDGVAVQRFINGIGSVINNSPAATLLKIKKSAEAKNKIFYICYDISSTGLDSSWENIIKFDWVYNIEKNYALTGSSAYATVNGKPVVEIWGTGFSGGGHPGTEAETIDLINFLKARGCYVIGGVPTYWRTETGDSKPAFINAYKAFNMISPWSVGRFGDSTGAANFKNTLIVPDKAYTDGLSIDYLPVIFPGFSWSQWNNATANAPNAIPRQAGNFWWQQALNIKSAGLNSMYFAMLDEYDEGTAIMKAATDYTMIPTDQYFVTTSADGTWTSSDFYLRLAGAGTQLLKGTQPASASVPIPYSQGPVYYRNSFEKRYTIYNANGTPGSGTGYFNIDPCFYNDGVITNTSVTSGAATINNIGSGSAKTGLFAAQITGTATSAGGTNNYYYKISQTKIAVKANMELSFWKNSVNALGQYSSVDLTFKSGKTLRSLSEYTDNNGNVMQPTIARGTVGTWQKFNCQIGKGELIGDTIVGITIAYDHPSATGAFTAYFDDVIIDDAPDTTSASTIPSFTRVTTNAQQFTKVEFAINVAAPFTNAYDATQISLDMIATAPSGATITQPCFYNSGNSAASSWSARFTPKEVGTYTYSFRLTQSGTTITNSSSSTFAVTSTTKDGFLHIVAGNNWILKFDDGKPFKGIGEDYAWQPRDYENQKYVYSYMIPRLAANGANFFRTWMCPWNLPLEWKAPINTNFYTSSTQYFNPSAIAGIDSLVNLSEANNMYMMITLNTFGDLIDQWSINSYNVANGGPCTTPNDFFALTAAKTMFKNRLRYIIARWGYSSSVAALELFNEIDNAVYGTSPNLTQSDVTEWHKEMSAYIKSIDPNGHMVTTSVSYRDITGLDAVPSFDFNQQHIYSDPAIGDVITKIPATIRSYDASTGKPYSIGEYGYDWRGPDATLGLQNDSNYRRGLWYGIFSPTPIAPMSWWWEMFDDRGTGAYIHNIQDISNKMIAAGGGVMSDLTVSGSAVAEKYGAQCGTSYFVYARNSPGATINTNLTIPVSGTNYDISIYNTTTGTYADQGISASVAGTLTLPVVVLGTGADVIMIATASTATAESAYGGTPWPIPGTVQAENYDNGGQGVAYNDADAANQGGQYRTTEGVDIETTTDVGGGYDVGYTSDGEWLKYSVNVTASGTYNIGFRTAATASTGVIRLEVDGVDVTGPVSLPNTSDYQAWVTTTVSNINLTAGLHTIRLFIVTGGFNLNYFTVTAPPTGPGYLQASGKNIINNNGNFVIKAINIGDFMIQEGYMMNLSGSQYIYKQKITAMIGATACDQFYANYYQNFVTKTDIDSIKKMGFNTIRLPLNYELFTPLGQPTVFLTQGFAIVDSIVSWCKADNIYVVLDLHAAPGGQNTGDISDYDPSQPSLWESTANQNQTVALWAKLAQRYANEPYVGGYDLINETNWTLPGNTLLYQLMQNITTAIRQVDNNHILFIEGNSYANDYTGMTPKWDNNMAYSFHKYWNDNLDATLNFALAVRDGQNVPIWMGEFGENSNNWIADAETLVNKYNIGWAIWPYKKMSSVSSVSSFNQPANWSAFADYVNGGAMPSAAAGQVILNELLQNIKVSNCTINSGYLYALFKQPGNTNTIPYNNTAATLPGKIIAANYDEGKNGYAYNDSLYQDTQYGSTVGSSTTWNNGWYYRNDGVDLQYSTAENGPTIGWTETNDWMQYTVNITTAGSYNVIVRAASGAAGGKISISSDGTMLISNATISATGGWDTWQNFNVGNVTLTAGTHKIVVTVTTPGYNISYLNFTTLAPVITSATTKTGTTGSAFSYNITATNTPTSYSVSGTLPAGLNLNTGTGLVSGTPTVAGTFIDTIKATNAVGTGIQVLTITINTVTPIIPVITSTGTASGTVGTAFGGYTITATNTPTSYSITGTLPAGLSLSGNVISGIPTVAGTFVDTVKATNANGTGVQVLTITIGAAPSGCSTSMVVNATSVPVMDGTVDAVWNNAPKNSITKSIQGTIQTGSTWQAMYDATNLYFLIQVKDANTSSVGTNLWDQDGVELFIAGNNNKTNAYTANDHQYRFNWNVAATTANISGTGPTTGITYAIPSVTGGYNLEVTIPWSTIGGTAPSNGKAIGFDVNINDQQDNTTTREAIAGWNGTATDDFNNPGDFGTVNLTVCAATAPVVTSATTASGTVGTAFSYSITATNTPTSYSVTGTLPAGVTINTTTGVISGTPTASGTFSVTVNATNAGGTGTQALTITILPNAPVITSSTTVNGTIGTAFSYSITATNTPTSYSETGALPVGITINTATGVISGTPTASGIFAITIKATNAGGTGTQSLTITILPNAPVITSAATASGTVGAAFSYTITATNTPTSYSETGTLPTGVTINTSTGVISGTPTTSGTFAVTVNATNAGGTGTQALTITILPNAPVITSATTASGTIGTAFSYAITATNTPTSYSETSALPAGVTINTSTGVISGTPTASGTFAITIKATNAGGTGTQSLTITILPNAPVITSATTTNGTVGAAFSYTITATNTPTSYSETGALPAGVTINTATGMISGTPTVSGTFAITIKATNVGGTGIQALTITILPNAPVITSVNTASGTIGTAFSYAITATNTPTSYSETSALPAGVTINTSTGVISGTPTASGTFAITIKATNAGGTGTQALTITILPNAPVITSATTASGTIGTAFSYTITATNTPTSYSETGTLPAGVTINTTTGVISGTPTANGTFAITIKATNAGGTGTQALTITILPNAPVITSATTANGTIGTAFSYTIAATNTPTSYSETGALPAGVTINTSTGVISGTPTASGTFAITIKATNAGGTGTQALIITILPNAPVITSVTTASGTIGTAFSYTITATNTPTSYSETGTLPAGVSINTTTGVISGTPTASGTFTVSVNVTNAGGTGTQSLAITILPNAPVITSAVTATGTAGTLFSYAITATNTPTSYSETGTLPAGVTINTATGVISGTPTASGTFAITIKATNAGGTGTQLLTITINAAIPGVPVITSTTTANGTIGTAFSYTIIATNAPTSYSVTGTLPAGVTINTATGVISGTLTTSGTFTVTLNATNTGGTGTQTLTITILPNAPVITSATTASGTISTAFSYAITATNTPTSYSETGTLPAGVTINTTTGVINGTPTASGTFAITIKATNAGGTGTQTLTITILPNAPVITSVNTASGTIGTAFSYTITAINTPTSYSETGALPAGVTINTATGIISGTPTAAGTFTFTLNATNAGGTGTQALTITILPNAPVITSATTASGTVGTAFSYTITATNTPTSYSETGALPAGVTINTATGVISGTPTASGTFAVTIKATNAGGTGTQALTITINTAIPATPVIASATTASGTVGTAFSYTITASNTPTSYSVTGTLPAGVTINTATGVINGTPTAAGTFTVTINATNAGGTGTQTLTITILPDAPVITSATTASGTVGAAFSYSITATNTPTSYSETGALPAGVTINTATGVISGTPTASGTFAVVIKATNTGGTGTQSLTITINAAIPGAPVITSANTASGVVGTAFSYTITATNTPTSYSVTGTLPAGVTINTTTGVIGGTPTAAGTFTVTINATNAGGTGTQTLTITILPNAPVITSATTASGTVGTVFSYAITATNIPTSYSVTGALPGGVTLNTATGVISGTPTASGTFAITIKATNAGGTGTQALTITINAAIPATPVIASAITASGTVGTTFSYTITASNTPTSYSVTGTLPAGVTINTATGVISGTPTASGTFTVTLNATNAGGTGTQIVTITINPLPLPIPVITSIDVVGTVNTAFSYTITATNSPTSYGSTTLPAGLSVNITTGLISGTPTVSGIFTDTLKATNATGTGTKIITITINSLPGLPIITSNGAVGGIVGTPFVYTITATNSPTSYSATNLPAGLSINTSTGEITGTPTATDTAHVIISATNASGTVPNVLTISITLPPIPVMMSTDTATANEGEPFTYTVNASNAPTNYTATGLPHGLSIDPVTGIISGTPTEAGTYPVTITATNSYGTATETLGLTVESSVPITTPKLMPNPVTDGHFKLTLPGWPVNTTVNVEIRNFIGMLVQMGTATISNDGYITVNVPGLIAGNYVIIVVDNNKKVTKKFTVK